MTLYCGIDLHCNNSVVAVQDERDRTVYQIRPDNDITTIIGPWLFTNPFFQKLFDNETTRVSSPHSVPNTTSS